jgi:uncharacterized protein with HEPN domain
MKLSSRGISILTRIIEYCQEIENTMDRFDRNYETFKSDSVYKNAVALCVLQIGELTTKLSDELKEKHSEIPWRQVKVMRNIVAHRYGTIEMETTWETITEDIPKLKQYCNSILNEQDTTQPMP